MSVCVRDEADQIFFCEFCLHQIESVQASNQILNQRPENQTMLKLLWIPVGTEPEIDELTYPPVRLISVVWPSVTHATSEVQYPADKLNVLLMAKVHTSR